MSVNTGFRQFIYRPKEFGPNQKIISLIEHLELFLIWLTLAIIPNFDFGAGFKIDEISSLLLSGFTFAVFVLESARILYENKRLNLGFLFSRFNLILAVPFLIALAVWATKGFPAYLLFGYSEPWHAAVLPTLSLLLWHFVLRSYFGSPSREVFLRFTWFLLILSFLFFTARQLYKLHNFYFLNSLKWAFVLWSFLALGLCLGRAPLSKKEAILRFGNASYLAIIALLMGAYFYYGFNFRHIRAGIEFSKGDFERALSLNPYHPIYSLSFADKKIKNIASLSKQEFSDALKLKDEVSSVLRILERFKKTDNPEVALKVARSYVELGKFAEGADDLAYSYYEKVLEKTARPEVLIEASGFFRDNVRQNEKSLLLIERALSLRPNDPPAVTQKAATLEALGRADEALSWLKQNKDLSIEVYYNYGRFAYNFGKLDEARDAFLKILEADANYSDANYSLAVYYYRKGELKKAKNYFEKVLDFNPKNSDVRKKIQDIDSRLGR